jgi:hypothetical protein
MIDLSKTAEYRQRQDSVWVDGVEYKIHTPFPFWIAFGKKFEDWQKEGRKEFSYEEFDYLYKPPVKHLIKSKQGKFARYTPGQNIPYIPDNKKAGFVELSKFYRNEQLLPRPSEKKNGVPRWDLITDSEYIRAEFWKNYKIDLLITDLHWHDFQGLFYALIWPLEDIMQIRGSTDKAMRELREAWELPELEIERPIFEMV